MPTTFYPRDLVSDATVGAGNRLVMSQKMGQTLTSSVTATTAGGTNITATATSGGTALSWFSGQIRTDVTISGAITVNIYGFESAATVNAAGGVLIERCDSSGTVLSTILADTVIGSEFGTALALRTASPTPTSTAMAVGERIKVTLKVRNFGTMGAGTVTLRYSTGALTTTNIVFTENILTDEVLDVPHYEIIGANGYKG